MLRVLMIGDIFSASGRLAISTLLPELKARYQVDLVIANGENITHGRGISPFHYEWLLDQGVHFVTTGNHFLAARPPKTFFDQANLLVRPANIDEAAWGVGSRVIECKGHRIRITNLIGRVFITELSPGNPFTTLAKIVEESSETIHLVDFHAEASAEKAALAHYFDGAISAIIGTHTHVQTSDARILPGGTGFMTDVGMTGPYHSIIGCEIESVVLRTRTGLPQTFKVAEGPFQFSGVLLDINPTTGHTEAIRALHITPDYPDNSN